MVAAIKLINLSWAEIQNRRYGQACDRLLSGLEPGDVDTRDLYTQCVVRTNLGFFALLRTGCGHSTVDSCVLGGAWRHMSTRVRVITRAGPGIDSSRGT